MALDMTPTKEFMNFTAHPKYVWKLGTAHHALNQYIALSKPGLVILNSKP